MTQRALDRPGSVLPADWWVAATNLRERLPLPPGASATDPTASTRLGGWLATHPALADGDLTRRLAEAGLDEAGLAWLLDEDASRLAARIDRPSWAGFVERAVARPPAAAAVEPADWRATLVSGLRPLLDAARADLAEAGPAHAEAADPGAADAVTDGFVDQLGRRLVRLAVRTLVRELSRARAQGALTGATPEERFADFTRRLADGRELAGMVERYPVLARVLGQACEQAVTAHRELLARFTADRADIVAALLGGVDPGPLVAADAGGDQHRRGRSVATLRFADGRRVVYKPRPLDLHQHFNDLVGWLGALVPDLDVRTVTVLRRDGYGWLEFIEHRPCDDEAQVRRFYHRQGALLALLYVLDGTDMHFENLVACGDQPVFVDVETLFHPTLPPDTVVGPDPAVLALLSSVHRTALLPLMLVGEHGVADLSGLGGDRGVESPNVGIDFADPGTDTMRLIRRPVPMPVGHNRPRLGDTEAEPAGYQPVLLAGFRAAYDAITAHRAELLGPDGLLARCAGDEIRFIPRPTQLYASLLDESTHPDALGDALDRDRLFDLLWTDSLDSDTRRRLVPHEVTDLWAGDIPMFTTRPGSRDVRAADGSPLPDLLDAPGLAAAEAKIARLGEVDRHAQEWLIAAAFATRPAPTGHRSGEPARGVTAVVPDRSAVLAAACGIADELLATAIPGDGRVNWLGLELVDDRQWTVLPLGAGLSTGYLGTALFLAQLADLTGASRYTELAADAIRPAPLLLESLAVADAETAAAVGCGFHGTGGIGYALARLGTLLGDDASLRGWLADAVEVATRFADLADAGGVPGTGSAVGVLEGEAGGLAAMLAVHAESGSTAARRLAERYADRLAELVSGGRLGSAAGGRLGPGAESGGRSGPGVASGFGRGPAGVGWALLRASATLGVPRYRDAGLTALALDPFDPLDADATASDTTASDVGWCGGLAGVVAASAGAGPVPEALVDALADRPLLRDLSLCHGELGAVEPLVELAAGDPSAAAAVRRRTGLVLGAIAQRAGGCGTPGGVSTPGLLTGLAGIGYGLLRLGYNGQVPSVLLLDTLPPAK